MTELKYTIPTNLTWPIIIYIPSSIGSLYTRVAYNENEFIKYADELKNELSKNNIIYNCEFSKLLNCMCL